MAHAFPHEFKLAYGADVMQLGEDAIEDIARTHGFAGLIRLLADIAVRVPIEYLSEMRRDMRYALRALIKSPGFALVGIVSLGLGMGVTTSVFSSVWAEMFRELPGAANAKRLVMAHNRVSYYYIEQYREQNSLFAGVAAFQFGIPFNVTFQGETNAKPERVFGQLVSPDYFSVLGVEPQRGRVLSAGLDKTGDAPVVVISDRFWRNRLNSAPNAVGQMLRLNGQTATIVGIAPKDFNGALSIYPAELFVPVTAPAALAPELANDVLHQRNAKDFLALMCLAPGVSIESAESAVDTITRHLDEQDPSAPAKSDKSRRVTLDPAGTMVPIPRDMKPAVMGFYATLLGLIMAIACMNLANMLLARGAARRKELAIRLAIGASRFRLVRQLMSEGILLSLLGGVAGFALAHWLSVLASRIKLPTAIPIDMNSSLDWHAALFAFALAIVCGVGFSLAPALKTTNTSAPQALKQGDSIQLPGYRRFGMRNLLVVAQVAGSLMLLLISGFLVLGFSKTNNIEAKFDPNRMYLLSIDPVRDGYTPEKAQALFENLPDRLRNAGVVDNIALSAQEPLSISTRVARVSAENAGESSRMLKEVAEEKVGAGYFATLNEPLIAGREFDQRDQRTPEEGSKTTAVPVVLDESTARGLFGNGNAVGARVRDDAQSYEVVGVVSAVKNTFGFRQSVMYLPLTRRDFAQPSAAGMTIVVQSNGGSDTLNGLRREIASIDPNLTILDVRTLSESLEVSRSSLRFAMDMYGGIGAFGLVLAALGLAGVTAYAVARRRKEIGIRMALGARKMQVLRLVLREGAVLVAVGTVLGFVGAIMMVRVLSALTNIFVESFRVATNDPVLLIGSPLLLAALAMLASYLPARKSAKIDPLRALREE